MEAHSEGHPSGRGSSAGQFSGRQVQRVQGQRLPGGRSCAQFDGRQGDVSAVPDLGASWPTGAVGRALCRPPDGPLVFFGEHVQKLPW